MENKVVIDEKKVLEGMLQAAKGGAYVRTEEEYFSTYDKMLPLVKKYYGDEADIVLGSAFEVGRQFLRRLEEKEQLEKQDKKCMVIFELIDEKDWEKTVKEGLESFVSKMFEVLRRYNPSAKLEEAKLLSNLPTKADRYLKLSPEDIFEMRNRLFMDMKLAFENEGIDLRTVNDTDFEAYVNKKFPTFALLWEKNKDKFI